VIDAFRTDAAGTSQAAVAGTVAAIDSQIERAGAGDSQAIFDLASNLNLQQVGKNIKRGVMRAADDIKVGAPRTVTIGEGANGGPAVQTVQGPGTGPLTAQEVKAARQRGVYRAKSGERELIRIGHPGTVDEDWSWDERREIAESGQFPSDTRWHHVNDVKRNPQLSDEPNNVRPVRGGTSGHVAKHHPQGGTRGGSSGELLDRDDLLRRHMAGELE